MRKEESGRKISAGILSALHKISLRKQWHNISNKSKDSNSGAKDKKSIWDKLQSIRVQLSIGILIPIIILSFFNVISYKKSEQAIINKYEASTSDTIDAISKFMNLGFSMIEKSSLEITLDINFKEFFSLSAEEALSSVKPMMTSMTEYH
jgi:hypothetical protein